MRCTKVNTRLCTKNSDLIVFISSCPGRLLLEVLLLLELLIELLLELLLMLLLLG